MATPEEYVSFNSVQRDRAQYVINEFVKNLKNISGKCMDIGCGPGDITNDILLPVLDLNAEIVGTDISESMIQYARRTYANEKRLKFEILDIQNENLSVKYISEFDHIFSFHALHWCKNIRQSFENIYRMLRPNGTIFLSLLAYHDTLFKVFETMEQDIRFAPYMKNEKKCVSQFDSNQPHEDLKDLLEDIEFYVHHCSPRKMSICDSNFALSLTPIATFLNEMSSDQKEEYIIEFARTYAAKRHELYSIKQDGTENITPVDTHTLLIVYAQKNAL